MYAIIRTGGGHYYTSTVFARLRDTSKDSWRGEYYLTLNEAKTALVRSYAFEQNTVYLNQLVLITQTDSTGWVADSDGFGATVLEHGGFYYYLIDSDEFDPDEDIHHIDKSYSWFKGKNVSYHVIPR